jgi:hypothetical protein
MDDRNPLHEVGKFHQLQSNGTSFLVERIDPQMRRSRSGDNKPRPLCRSIFPRGFYLSIPLIAPPVPKACAMSPPATIFG